MADPRFCPHCGKADTLKAHDVRVSYEVGWNYSREEPVSEGEALCWHCEGCGQLFMDGPSLGVLEECSTRRCKKCGSELDSEDYCGAPSCPFSEWPQEVATHDLLELTELGLERKYRVRKRETVE